MRNGGPRLFGHELENKFQLPTSQSLILRAGNAALAAVTYLRSSTGQPDPTKPVPAEKGFTIPVYLSRPIASNWGSWIDGRYTPTPKWEEGGIGIYDLESDPRVLRDTAFEVVHFNIPRATLNAFTDDACLPPICELHCPEGWQDPVLHHLAEMILPFVREKTAPPSLFVHQYVQMLCARLVLIYRANISTRKFYRGGLSPLQKRRALELLEQNLAGDLRLNRLASECGLSTSYFCRCFRVTFGTSVHKFVVKKRIERAQQLLLRSKRSLAEIAIEAGFTNQCAFSRTFGLVIGTPPARWRAEHLVRARRSVLSRSLDAVGLVHSPEVNALIATS